MRLLLRSLRILRKNWKLAAIAVFSLSVAMALAVVSLGVSNTSLLAPPPGDAPDRLVMIYSHTPKSDIDHFSYRDFEFYRQNNRVFSDMAAIPESIAASRQTLSGPDGTEREVVFAENEVTGNYFSVLGIQPYLGRLLSSGDDGPKPLVAILTYSGWTRLGSDRNIVGKTLDDRTIVGVAPKGFTGSLFGINGDMMGPLTVGDIRNRPNYTDLIFLARLKPGVTREQAQADMSVLAAQLAAAYPKEDQDRTALVTRATLLPPDAIPNTEWLVAILMILVFLVLLIACANVANLLLALAVGRRNEATVKLALGASRTRIVREFLTESIVICVVSSVVGYVLAELAIARYSLIAVDVPMMGPYSVGVKLHLGLTVVAATVALMFIAIVAAGLPAALYASSPNLSQVLSGEIAVGGTRKRIRRSVLVVVQIAVCTLVLVGMGLCQRSLYNLRHVDPGFSARSLLTEAIFPGDANYTEAQGKALYSHVRQLISELPGVQGVALARDIPFFGGDGTSPVGLQGQKPSASALSTVVDENYFSTLGIALLAGRPFNASDTSPDADSVIVNHQLAETLWPGRDAIGRVVLTGDPPRKAVVVGVAADSKYDDLSEDPRSFVYYAASQHYTGSLNVIARTAGDPRLWIEPVTRTVTSMGFAAEFRPMTMDEVENMSLLPERIITGCVAGLSALGLLLSIVGLFGAISYSVSERKRELGIRVALGAGPWQLLKMILRQTLLVAGMGTAVGIVLGVVATMLLRSQFFRIGTVEWSVLMPVAAAMVGVSLVVAYLSARRWVKVDPMEAVRHT